MTDPAAREAAASDHHAVDLIRAKRDGQRLPDAQIRWLFDRYLAAGPGAVPDEQMSALLMAIYFRGLDPAELRPWTAAMIDSGERLDLSPWAARRSTSIPPAASATRCRWSSRRSWLAAEPPSRNCPD